MGPDRCRGVVRPDGGRDFGGHRNYPSCEMLPIVLLEIFYKVLWLILVAYPLWAKGSLWGSPAEAIALPFLWVPLPIVAAPWGHVFMTSLYKPKKYNMFFELGPKGTAVHFAFLPNEFSLG